MYCSNCGHKNDDNAAFCEECGHKLEQDVDMHAAGPNTSEVPGSGGQGTVPGVDRNNGTSGADGRDPHRKKDNKVKLILILAVGFVLAIVIFAVVVYTVYHKLTSGIMDKDGMINPYVTEQESEDEYDFGSDISDEKTEEDDADEDDEETLDKVGAEAFPDSVVGSWYDGNFNISTADGKNFSIVYPEKLNNGMSIRYTLNGIYANDEKGERIKCSGNAVCYDETLLPHIEKVKLDDIYIYTEDESVVVHNEITGEDFSFGQIGDKEAPKEIYYLGNEAFSNNASMNTGFVFANSEYMEDFTVGPLKLNVPYWANESNFLVQEEGYDNSGYAAVDGDAVTSWQMEGGGLGDWMSWDYGEAIDADVISLQLGNWRDYERYMQNDRAKTLKIVLYNEYRLDKNGYRKEFVIYADFPDDMIEFGIKLPYSFTATGGEIDILDKYDGELYDDMCISEIKVFTRGE